MAWTIEYFEQADSTQPAETFEDELDRSHPKLAGKLARLAGALANQGHRLGGGFIEPCHGYSGLWEIRAIQNRWLGRELFGFDESRIVLLHGYVKWVGQPASVGDLERAHRYWQEYLRTHKISPAKEEPDEPL
jgi:hypothetical protein